MNPAMCPVCQQCMDREIHADKRILMMDEQGSQVALPVTILICKKCSSVVIKKRAEIAAVAPAAKMPA